MGRPPPAALALAAVLLSGGVARAQVDEPVEALPTGKTPNVRWYTLETPHFDIHYYEDERAFAERAAHFAERAYRLITRYLNWQPNGHVSLTLVDHTDSANGYASSVPYNYIYAYGIPPDPFDELSDFDDYVKLLVTHELTHVVHLDTILSLCPRALNSVLGKIYAPNLAQPTWFIEGLAVLMETRQTTAGRLRSSFYDMHLRVPFLEGRSFGIDAVSNIPLAYPGPTAAYLYGSSLLRYVEDRYGPRAIREISHRYGDECIAGGINRVTGRAVGRGYVESFGPGIWSDWRRSTAHHFALELDEAAARGLTVGRRLTSNGPGARGIGPRPRFLADGGVLYYRSNDDQSPAYVRVDLHTATERTIADVLGAGVASPTPDGRALIFQQTTFVPLPWRISGNAYADWTDIYRLDLAAGSIRQLTRALRAHEPDVSPDGAQIAFVMAGTNARHLALLPIGGGAPRILDENLPGFAYTPAWSPDGKQLAYSRWSPGGYRDIHVYDVSSGSDRALMTDRAMDLDPRFTPDGRYLLFSSDRTGIYNIYAHELATGRLWQVTNVVGGAFQPVLSPDGRDLVYVDFTTDGFDLFTMPFEPARFLAAQPYANSRLDSPSDPDADDDSPDAAPGDEIPLVATTKPYQPWKYLYPRQWTLSYYTDPLGIGDSVYVDTDFADPVGNHSLSASILLPANGDASLAANYSYQRLWPSLGASVRRTAQRGSGLIIDGHDVGYRRHVLGASLVTDLPVLSTPNANADISFGYDYTAYRMAQSLPPPDPTAAVTQKPDLRSDADVFMRWSFSSARSWPYSISPQTGRSLQLYLRLADPQLGGNFHTTEVSWSWSEFLTMPWARLHVLALLWGGGVGLGDKRDSFQLGGYVEQDVVRAIFLNQRECCFYLRGYPGGSFHGDSYEIFSAEYRAPLLWIERGFQTFPLYLRRVWGALFVDSGNAYEGSFQPESLKTDVGAEANLQLRLAYFIESQLKIGFAHGFSAPGGNLVYFLAAASF